MSQRTKTLMPTASTLLRPGVMEGVEDNIKQKRQKVKSWQAGTLIKQLCNRSYLVRTGSETIHRNRQFLKPLKQSAAKVGLQTSPKVTKPVGVPVPRVSIKKSDSM